MEACNIAEQKFTHAKSFLAKESCLVIIVEFSVRDRRYDLRSVKLRDYWDFQFDTVSKLLKTNSP